MLMHWPSGGLLPLRPWQRSSRMQSRLAARRLLAAPAVLATLAGGLVASVAGAAAPAAAAPAVCSPSKVQPPALARGLRGLSRAGGLTGAISVSRCGRAVGGAAAGRALAVSPRADNPSSIFTAVRAVSASDVWAVGSHLTSSGASVALIEHWDGSSWTVMHSPAPGAASELT